MVFLCFPEQVDFDEWIYVISISIWNRVEPLSRICGLVCLGLNAKTLGEENTEAVGQDLSRLRPWSNAATSMAYTCIRHKEIMMNEFSIAV